MDTLTQHTQPEALALWLADRLNAWPDAEELDDAAAELRRLHEVNQELLEALKELVTLVQELPVITDQCKTVITSGAYVAIAKATGSQV